MCLFFCQYHAVLITVDLNIVKHVYIFSIAYKYVLVYVMCLDNFIFIEVLYFMNIRYKVI